SDRTALLSDGRVLLRRLERQRPQAKNPGFWLSHLLAGLHCLLSRGDRTPEERAAALAGRLAEVPQLLEDARATLVAPVRVFVETALRVNEGGLLLEGALEGDLARRAARMDGGPGWQDVADRLRADHPPATALVEAYAREMARARDFVAQRGLAPIPDAPLDVVPTPAFMRPIIPFAAYDSPGPYSRDRTGWFYVTVPDPRLPAAAQERMLRDHCRHELAATALHAGYPGHHLHLVQAQRQASETRKNVSTPP